jgi:hypothetical protein
MVCFNLTVGNCEHCSESCFSLVVLLQLENKMFQLYALLSSSISSITLLSLLRGQQYWDTVQTKHHTSFQQTYFLFIIPQYKLLGQGLQSFKISRISSQAPGMLFTTAVTVVVSNTRTVGLHWYLTATFRS